jgi:predicted ester cyclase
MQAFLGYFDPAEATRMAQGGGTRFDGQGEAGSVDHVSAMKDHVADESLLQCLSALQKACPDLEVVIENSIAEGDQVAIRFAVASHQNGNERTLAPGMLLYRVAGGKIVEHWLQPDVPALLEKLGAVPTPART